MNARSWPSPTPLPISSIHPSAVAPRNDPGIQIEVWRQAARLRSVAASLRALLGVFARVLPVEAAILGRVEESSSTLDVLGVTAVADSEGDVPSLATRVPLYDPRFGDAFSEGRVCLGDAGCPSPLSSLLAAVRVEGHFVAGLLTRGPDPVGIIILPLQRAPELDDLALVESCLDPISLLACVPVTSTETVPAVLRAANESGPSSSVETSDDDALIGDRAGLRGVVELVERVAATGAPVLIVGETGVGKEVVARAIHARSLRAKGPLIKVNCGAIPPELIDSELFGHERGSFTGAVALRKGWFERADGGTLFLDEIGELPLAAQVRLLRVLQDGILERVGGQRVVTTDVRVVAATHRDLHAMVSEGRFRRDLWYRMSVFPLHIPPLRDRPEDIKLLAEHFAARSGRRHSGRPLEPSEEDIALLTSYGWPGNVRELSAVIERATILGAGRRLATAAALQSFVAVPPSLPDVPERIPSQASHSLDVQPLDVIVARHIEHALRVSNGQIEGARGAAALLGINPHTLRARMRKLGIDWTVFRLRTSGSGTPTRTF